MRQVCNGTGGRGGKWSDNYKCSYTIKAVEFKSLYKYRNNQFADQSNEPGSFKHLALWEHSCLFIMFSSLLI